MTNLAAGSRAKLIINPGEIYRVETAGTATVTTAYGAPDGTVTVTAGYQDFGPYSVPAKLHLLASSGPAHYTILQTQDVEMLNGTLTGDAVGAVRSTAGIGSVDASCLFYIPGAQFPTSGNAKDLSGRAADAVIGAGTTDAEVWANAGFITTKAATNGHLKVPNAKISSMNLSSGSAVVAFLMKRAAPGTGVGSQALIGPATGGALSPGFYAVVTEAGKMQITNKQPGGGGPGTQLTAASTASVADDTLHHVVIGFDAITGEIKLFVDGALSNSYAANSYNRSLAAVPLYDFAIGGQSDPSGVGYVGQFGGVQVYYKSGVGLPSNLSLLAARLAANPKGYLEQGALLW